MCGILGGFTRSKLEISQIVDALSLLRHRGPDDSGIFQDDTAFLGARRLSIIDLAGGHQPVTNEDGTVVAVLNGEIYNYRELTHVLKQSGHTFRSNSDTEVIVHAYEEWGNDMVQKFRGMFAFALWEKRNARLVLGRDRFGKKPLYYTLLPGGGILFASEIKAVRSLADACGVQWSVSGQAIYDYLSLMAVPQPQTIYKEVNSILNASLAIYDATGLKTKKYWQLQFRPKTERSGEAVLEEARAQIGEAVRLRLRSDVPLGLFLSGGIDSSIIAYEAARVVGGSLRTFTVAVADERLDESPVAARTAQALGIENTVLRLEINPLDILQKVVSHFDQPFADASAIPNYAVSLKAREFVTVVLNGDGGDELFGGYRRYLGARVLDRCPWLQALARLNFDAIIRALPRKHRSLGQFLERLFRGARLSPGERYITWTNDTLIDREKRRLWKGSAQRPTEDFINKAGAEGLSMMRKQMHQDQQLLLLSVLLVKMDMATMFASVEARSPLLDQNVAEFSATIPDHLLVRGLQSKAVLRDAYRGRLSDEVINGRKRGFEIPLQRWLENDLQPMLRDVFASNSKVSSYLDVAWVQKMVSDRSFKTKNLSYLLYSLLVLELWLREASVSQRLSECPVAA